MTIEYDDKGKFFTNIISKTAVAATVQTVTHRIHGNVHVRQGERLKDELEVQENYLAMTDIVIYSADDRVLYHSDFLAIRCSQIVWVLPNSQNDDRPNGDNQ